ncbi:hypothetical protein HELRODRAFT_179771 [Helobdella robusta]|uniref:Uncharacterized protein n=1 Tax=Helobdella robusta TaxID=6412 RepID=T1FF49_HELRO|nr:hypothetical protein HELRODRAFT_179771 [Helobdella robusta]ESN95173.1 hypothetical protein HELRODRAFT_179771 [Helobdella robusta]
MNVTNSHNHNRVDYNNNRVSHNNHINSHNNSHNSHLSNVISSSNNNNRIPRPTAQQSLSLDVIGRRHGGCDGDVIRSSEWTRLTGARSSVSQYYFNRDRSIISRLVQ